MIVRAILFTFDACAVNSSRQKSDERAESRARSAIQPAVAVAYVSSRVNRTHSRALGAREAEKLARPSAQACQKPFVSSRE